MDPSIQRQNVRQVPRIHQIRSQQNLEDTNKIKIIEDQINKNLSHDSGLNNVRSPTSPEAMNSKESPEEKELDQKVDYNLVKNEQKIKESQIERNDDTLLNNNSIQSPLNEATILPQNNSNNNNINPTLKFKNSRQSNRSDSGNHGHNSISPNPAKNQNVKSANSMSVIAEVPHKIVIKKPSYPMDSKTALKYFSRHLTRFEIESELATDFFDEIYFTGAPGIDKIDAVIPQEFEDPSDQEATQSKIKSTNHGFDNADGSYKQIKHDHINYRYEIIEELGSGSFGNVVKVIDHKILKQNEEIERYIKKKIIKYGPTDYINHIADFDELNEKRNRNCYFALKIVKNKARYQQQAMKEVKILSSLKSYDKHNKLNVVHLFDYFIFRNHFCMTFELLGINLYQLIQKNYYRGFSLNIVRRIAIAVLKCLYALYKDNIIHCDLKPENILVYPKHVKATIKPSDNQSEKNEDGKQTPHHQNGIKVIDFGSSCYTNEKIYTYIQSRFYRAPEIILGKSYDMPIDMWSFGCIMAELYTGIPCFPGEDENEQISMMLELLGLGRTILRFFSFEISIPNALLFPKPIPSGHPDPNDLRNTKRARLFFNIHGDPKPKIMVNSKNRKRSVGAKTFESKFKCKDFIFLDFISKLITWSASSRMTPIEAIRHEFIQKKR